MQWTSSDNLRARDAPVNGGPLDGMRVAVNDSRKGLRYPDVVDMTGYRLDVNRWTWVWTTGPHTFEN